MKPFSRQEAFVVALLVLFVASLTIFNLNISIRRARDAQRKADLGAISDALDKYYEDFGFFPPSVEGKILACKGDNFTQNFEEIRKAEVFDRTAFFAILVPCDWGKDGFRDATDDSYEPYLTTVPQDPKKPEGADYLYLSNTLRFQLFAHLEGEKSETGYDQGIVKRNLTCGTGFICNFGKSFGETPLNQSIEDYEQELLERLNTGTK